MVFISVTIVFMRQLTAKANPQTLLFIFSVVRAPDAYLAVVLVDIMPPTLPLSTLPANACAADGVLSKPDIGYLKS
jgi:hypothetical protein